MNSDAHDNNITIDDLPNEVLLAIFSLASAGPQRNIIHISHVCVRWREVSIHTSILWRKVLLGGDFKEMGMQPSTARDWVKRADTFIRRAKDLPLDLVVELEERDISGVDALVSMIAAYGHKSRSLIGRMSLHYFTICFLPDSPWSALTTLNLTNTQTSPRSMVSFPDSLDSEGGAFPALRHLTLIHFTLPPNSYRILSNVRSFTWTGKDESTRDVFRTLRYAPFLEELDIKETRMYGQPHDDPPMLLPHLIKLNWSYPSRDQVYLFLSSFDTPNLAEINICVEPWTVEHNQEPRILPRLHLLSLKVRHESDACCFNSFYLPEITSLNLFYHLLPYAASEALPGIFPMMNRGFHNLSSNWKGFGLRKLSLTHFILSGNLISFIRPLVCLSSIRLEGCHGVDHFLGSMAEEPHTCPALTELHFINVTIDDVDCLIRLVEVKAGGTNLPSRHESLALHRRATTVMPSGSEKSLRPSPASTSKTFVTQPITTLHLIDSEGIWDEAESVLRATVDSFVCSKSLGRL